MAPLVAGSNGPPSADPFGDELDGAGPQPWPECLRGDVAEGFSLVVFEGGSVEQLVACAQQRAVTAVYVLADGEWVPTSSEPRSSRTSRSSICSPTAFLLSHHWSRRVRCLRADASQTGAASR